MTTAVHQKPPAPLKPAAATKAAPTPAKILHLGLVPIDKIDRKNNIRKTFDPVKMQQLTDSVKEHGVNQPILLRPGEEEGRYELVSGERRIRASEACGLKDIPAMVKDYTGPRAGIAQAIENLQREDVPPMDEAYGFKALVDANEFTVKQLADQLDKSEEYVYRAIRLLQSHPDVIDAIRAGEITASHGHQLLRLTQEEAREWLSRARGVTAAQLKELLDQDAGSDLEKATFPKNKPYAGEVACSACPRNSGNQGMLFDGAEKGRCMDTRCFDKKTTQAEEDQLAALRKKHPDAKFVIKVNGWVQPDYTEFNGYKIKGRVAPEAKLPKDHALVYSARDGGLYFGVPAPKPKAAAPATPAPTPKPADPKEKFLQEAAEVAIMKAAAVEALKLKADADYWRRASENGATDLPEEIVAGILGCETEQIEATLEKASEAKLRAIALLNARLPYNIQKEDFKKIGVNVAAVEKRARKEAEAEWAQMNTKHKSVYNAGFKSACGLTGLAYEKDRCQTKGKGWSVPTWEETTCPKCLKKKGKDE